MVLDERPVSVLPFWAEVHRAVPKERIAFVDGRDVRFPYEEVEIIQATQLGTVFKREISRKMCASSTKRPSSRKKSNPGKEEKRLGTSIAAFLLHF